MKSKMECLGMFSGSYGKYCWTLYKWIPNFAETLMKLEEEDEIAFINYLNSIYNRGISEVLVKEGKIQVDSCGEVLLKTRGKNHSVRVKITQTPENLSLAANYLKNTFGEHISNESDLKEIICAGLNGIETQKRNIILKTARDQEWDLYTLWGSILIYAEADTLPLSQIVQNDIVNSNNIYMDSKGVIQEKYSLKSRCQGAERITLINYAGTAFFANQIVTKEALSEWDTFIHNMLYGGTKVDIVLTDPESPAASDAERYKMKPKTLRPNMNISTIIPKNIEEIKRIYIKHDVYDLQLYLTDIALPCAYFRSEFKNMDLNNIKIDLYLPSFSGYVDGKNSKILFNEQDSDDMLRQSFMIYYKDNPTLYNTFSRNMDEIILHSQKIDLEIE